MLKIKLKKGISLALGKSKEADLNIIVIDNSSKKINKEIQNMINSDTIIFLNKSDVSDKQNHKFDVDTILASVKNNQNIDKLINLVKVKLSKKFISNNSALITRERHRVKLNDCLKEINKFLKKDQNKEIELAAEDLRMATRHLGSIVGKVDVEEILGSIFKDFCIGKQNTSCIINLDVYIHNMTKQSYDVVVIGGGHAGCGGSSSFR